MKNILSFTFLILAVIVFLTGVDALDGADSLKDIIYSFLAFAVFFFLMCLAILEQE
jgi:hypothetical protein